MSKNEPDQNVEYGDAFETMLEDAKKMGISDDEAWQIWQAGKASKKVIEIIQADLNHFDEFLEYSVIKMSNVKNRLSQIKNLLLGVENGQE